MAATKNLCAQIPTDLHQRVCEAREESSLTTAQYITNLLMPNWMKHQTIILV